MYKSRALTHLNAALPTWILSLKWSGSSCLCQRSLLGIPGSQLAIPKAKPAKNPFYPPRKCFSNASVKELVWNETKLQVSNVIEGINCYRLWAKKLFAISFRVLRCHCLLWFIWWSSAFSVFKDNYLPHYILLLNLWIKRMRLGTAIHYAVLSFKSNVSLKFCTGLIAFRSGIVSNLNL